jgi:hypothetical protein
MGLDLFSTVWDYIIQAAFFLMIAMLFLLLLAGTTNDGFFTQYYAKDLGLTIEVAHAARGDLQITYDKLLPAPSFDYKLEKNALLLRTDDPQALPVSPWAQNVTRKRFGQDSTLPDGILVQEIVLAAPRNIVLEKRGRALTLAEAGTASSSCPSPAHRPLHAETALTMDGSSPLLGPQLKELETKFRPSRQPTTIIRFTVQADPAATGLSLTFSGQQDVGEALACRIARNLAPLQVQVSPASAATTTLPGTTQLIFTHPATLPQGTDQFLNDQQLSVALVKALAEVLQ